MGGSRFGWSRRSGRQQRWWARVWSWLVLLLFVGCMKKEYSPPPPPMMEEAYGGYADDFEVAERSMAPRPKRAPSAAAPAAPPPPPPPPGAAPVPAPAEPVAPARKIHYSGYAKLRVTSVEETADQLTAAAKELGGFVESVTSRVVTLRVPVDRFEAAFDQFVELGELLDRSITARDVTEAFFATDLRLTTARKTRDRLVELLAKAEDEQEKLALIQQIQRVTEEIDRLESQLRTLDSLANMSRITIELHPREAQAWRDRGDDTAEMAWIRALSPFRPDLVGEGKKLDVPVPEGMVQLTPKRRFIAEGPGGSRIWSGRLPNEPAGDGAFWATAIQTRVGPEFGSAEAETIGGFTVLKLTDRGDRPYTWWVAVKPQGKWLEVVEVYFPTPAELERFEDAVRTALAQAGGAA